MRYIVAALSFFFSGYFPLPYVGRQCSFVARVRLVSSVRQLFLGFNNLARPTNSARVLSEISLSVFKNASGLPPETKQYVVASSLDAVLPFGSTRAAAMYESPPSLAVIAALFVLVVVPFGGSCHSTSDGKSFHVISYKQ